MILVTDKSKFASLLSQETPFFVWDLNVFKARIQHVLAQFSCVPNFRLHYAIKANSSHDVVCAAGQCGISVDVCSVNEMQVALECGFPPERVSACLFAPSQSELREFVKSGCDIDLDSLEDLESWCKIPGSKDSVGLRINPDVQAGFHEHCACGVWDSKFGIAIPDIPEALSVAERYGKTIDGLHLHVGSSAYETGPYLKAIELILQAVNIYNLDPRYINIGGGWGIPFDTQDDLLATERFPLEDFAQSVADLFVRYKIGRKTGIRAEPGEYLIGPSGFLVCTVRRVFERRKGFESKKIVVIDGGTYLYPGPALYGSDNFVLLLNREEERMENLLIAGRSMMAGDYFGPERLMPKLRPGDIVAIGSAGAYSIVKSSSFNLLPEATQFIIK